MFAFSRDSRSPDQWQARLLRALAEHPAAAVAAPVRAVWTAGEIAWEQCQEQAALAYRSGDARLPRSLWLRALEIAERDFARGDPRLATSFTNAAVLSQRQGDTGRTRRHFREALETWDESWRWITAMTSPSGGTLKVYDRAMLQTFFAFAQQGRAATLALAQDHPERLPEGRLELWLRLRPHRYTDLRKLLSAVLLIAAPKVH